MTQEEKLDLMLQYLSENPGADNLWDFSQHELGMDTEAYGVLVNRLYHEGMIEQKDTEDRFWVTCEGKFLLLGGGYQVLAFSKAYQKSQRKHLFKGRFGLKADTEKALLWVTGAAVCSFLAMLGVLLKH
jgi:hypothetical protein